MKNTTGKKIWIVKNTYKKTQAIVSALEALCLEAGFVFDEENPEIIISVGGDGTLLAALHYYETQLETVRLLGFIRGIWVSMLIFKSMNWNRLLKQFRMRNLMKPLNISS